MKTYHGSCHCGAVQFSVTTDMSSAITCNCSHWARKGFLLHFVPKGQFTLESGADSLTEYRFNKKHIAHLFCKMCGVQCFGYGSDPEGNETVAVNLNTLENFSSESIAVVTYDGKSV
jgi:hypothetical protein